MSSRVRLDRLLSHLGYGTRRDIGAWVDAGHIQLDGVTLDDPSMHLLLSDDLPMRLCVEGKPLDPLPGLVVMLHKPCGMTCSHKESGPLIYDVLPPRWKRRTPAISSIGRLDKDTSGLLLLTDDGTLLHRITSPKQHVSKTYRATLARPLQGTEAQLFSSGTLLLQGEEKPLLPALLEVLSPTEARLTVHEGRYHQVRRMFAAAGNHVLTLHREKIGALCLPDDLAPGSFCLLSAQEIPLVFTRA